MRYMMFIRHAEDFRIEEVPASLFKAMGEFVGEAMKNGSIVDTAGLQPTAKGKRVRLAGGKISVVDGPFTETKGRRRLRARQGEVVRGRPWRWRIDSWTCTASIGRSSRAPAKCGRSRVPSRRSESCVASLQPGGRSDNIQLSGGTR